ncbi:hypothetical protein JVU11DRAFT_7812 [Chiua virens]|nr:hypothetical protein JVU11DRAFT_7812 [Chiua virens]
MSYVILGRSIKNEYLTLGTLFTVGATVFAMKGGKKDAVAASKPLQERVKDAVPIKAESRMNSIKNFIAEAEKESSGTTIATVTVLDSVLSRQLMPPQDSPSSALPSPPMSPSMPPTRIRIKQKRPHSMYIDSVDRTQSLPPSLSRIVVDDSKTVTSRSKRRQSSITYFSTVLAVPRKPATTIKHADLLHFIAQKERKCLELRDQLAAHETELAELKRKWERIVNRGYDPFSSTVSSPGLSGTALDGLKEGVRMIAAGFTDLGGVLNELESGRKDVNTIQSQPVSSTHLASAYISTRPSSIHDTTDSERRLDIADGETTAMSMSVTVATAPSLTRTASLNHRVHKRNSRAFVNEPTTPTTNTYVSLPPDPKPALDLDSDAGRTPLSAALIRGKPLSQEIPHTLTTPVAPPTTAGPMAWMDTMSKRLGGLQRTTTLAKSQKRASSLLAGVSNTINAALTPGPTATTPAPLPIVIATASTTTKPKVSSARQQPPPLHTPSHPQPTYTSITDWLEEEEEMAQVGGVDILVPESRTCAMDGAAASVATFDDDWNW